MTDRIDHAAEARQALVQAKETPADPSVVADPWLLAAQVHATLALVEQERIANLIAYVQLLESQYAEAAKHPDEFNQETRAASVERHGMALGRIREGLSLS